MEVDNSTMATRANEPKLDSILITFHVIVSSIVFLGFLGNTLILVVMCNRKVEKSSTGVYLCVLAVSDSLMLFSGPLNLNMLPKWFGIRLNRVHIVSCWILKFLLFWSRHLSAWCIVLITVERLIAILKPHR